MLNELNNNFVIECNWIYVADVNKYIREKKLIVQSEGIRNLWILHINKMLNEKSKCWIEIIWPWMGMNQYVENANEYIRN